MRRLCTLGIAIVSSWAALVASGQAPDLDRVDPPALLSLWSARVQVTGERFTPTSQVVVNGTPLPGFATFVDANRLAFRVPAGVPSGSYSIVVRDTGGDSEPFHLRVLGLPAAAGRLPSSVTYYSTFDDAAATSAPAIGPATTHVGLDFPSGTYRGAARFAEATDAVRIASPSVVSMTRGAIEFDYRPETATFAGDWLLHYNPGQKPSFRAFFRAGRLVFAVDDANGTPREVVSATSSFANGVTVRIRLSWATDVPADPLRIHIDGLRDQLDAAPGALSLGASPAAPRDLFVGTRDGLANSPNAAGSIDELWIFGDPLARSPLGGVRQHETSPIGSNVGSVHYYSRGWSFVDVFKQSAPWIPQQVQGGPWNTQAVLQLRPDGYPASLASGQAAGTLMCRSLEGHYPAGTYTCRYDGDGDLWFGLDGRIVAQQPGGYTVQVDTPTSSGIWMKIVRTNPSDPIRNIRVIMPGFADHAKMQPFHPEFLERLRRYPVLRLMDWQRTNETTLSTWSARTTPQSSTQDDSRGVALEYQIQLANTLGVDAWFCIPHLADDAFVTQFATMVRDRLDPSLKAYIEYSNECWNSTYAQSQYCRVQGQALALSTNPFQAQLRFYARRSVEIFGIWSSVFGSNARLVRVLAGQSANPWTGQQILDWQGASASADAYATAPYFGNPLGDPATQATVEQWSVQQVVDWCAGAMTTIRATMTTNATNAAARNVELIAYEGGQHLVGWGGAENNTTLMNLFIATNRDPRMAALYQQYFDAWKAAGGRLFVNFIDMGAYSKWGSWGILEHEEQTRHAVPKHSAVMRFIEQNPRWW